MENRVGGFTRERHFTRYGLDGLNHLVHLIIVVKLLLAYCLEISRLLDLCTDVCCGLSLSSFMDEDGDDGDDDKSDDDAEDDPCDLTLQ